MSRLAYIFETQIRSMTGVSKPFSAEHISLEFISLKQQKLIQAIFLKKETSLMI